MPDRPVRLTEVVRERWETGAHGGEHLRFTPDDWAGLRQQWPAPPRVVIGTPLGSLLGIPIVVDPDLAPGTWRLVETTTGRVVEEHQINLENRDDE